MPDARVQAAIDNWAPRFTTNGVDPNDFRTTTARIERWDEWLDAWAQTADGPPRARRGGARRRAASGPPARRSCARPCAYHFAKFVWVVDAERNRADDRAGDRGARTPRTSCSTRPPSASRRRSTARASSATCAARGTSSEPPLVIAHPRPGLDEGGVLPLGGRLPRARHGDAVARRARARARPASSSTSGPTTRSPSARCSTRSARAGRRRPRARRRGGRQPRRLLRAARGGVRAAHQGGRRRQRAVRLRAPTGTGCRRSRARRSQHHTGAATPEEARERAAALNLDGVAERIDQPAWSSPAARPADPVGRTRSGSPTRRRTRRGSCSTTATTSATTSRTSTARSWATGCGTSFGEPAAQRCPLGVALIGTGHVGDADGRRRRPRRAARRHVLQRATPARRRAFADADRLRGGAVARGGARPPRGRGAR